MEEEGSSPTGEERHARPHRRKRGTRRDGGGNVPYTLVYVCVCVVQWKGGGKAEGRRRLS